MGRARERAETQRRDFLERGKKHALIHLSLVHFCLFIEIEANPFPESFPTILPLGFHENPSASLTGPWPKSLLRSKYASVSYWVVVHLIWSDSSYPFLVLIWSLSNQALSYLDLGGVSHAIAFACWRDYCSNLMLASGGVVGGIALVTVIGLFCGFCCVSVCSVLGRE